MMEHSARYFSNELSLLEFNERVLAEGLSAANPLLERLRFLAIISSNFDEFFMVRVAALKSKLRPEKTEHFVQAAGDIQTEELLERISSRVRDMIRRQYDCLASDIFPALAAEGLSLVRPNAYDTATRQWLDSYFETQVAPALTPLSFSADELGPIPPTGNMRIHAAFIAHADDAQSKPASETERVVIIQVPSNMGRFVRLPSGPGVRFALLDDLVMEYGNRLFPGYSVRTRTLFKVTRDADIEVDEDRADDFVAAMEEAIINRQSARPVRLSVSAHSEELEKKLMRVFGLREDDVYRMDGPIDLKGFMELADIKGFSHLRYPPRPPRITAFTAEDNTVWDEIRKRDIVLHLPYESFKPIVEFVEEAAADPAVIALKATLYRTSGESPVVKALAKAARAGKQVTAVVELKARFDEERNMSWAAALEQAGAIVVYGILHAKVHAKALLVVRRDEDGYVRRYVHLSTGNYNDKTALVYGDISVFTANATICAETSAFFNTITGLSALPELGLMSMAPFGLKQRILAMIQREAERSSPEAPGFIAAKMNALCDKDIIDALYKASAAGVRILLNVRGICQLVPGISGLSENIKVLSIVGRYLEHARVCYFRNGGAEELYVSSADWMPRNFTKRIELLFPVVGTEARKRVKHILFAYFRDTVNAWELNGDGSWHKRGDEEAFSAQDYFYEEYSNETDANAACKHIDVLKARRNMPSV